MTTEAQDRELLDRIKQLFNERIPFNQVIGVVIDSLDYDHPKTHFDMRPELVGNYMRGNLHGGVISSVIDVTGGLAAFLGVQKRLADEPLEAKLERFGQLGTIDLRIDYLRPGFGKRFETTGYVLRTGNKVAVVRIELHNDEDNLIAVGTGAYVVG